LSGAFSPFLINLGLAINWCTFGGCLVFNGKSPLHIFCSSISPVILIDFEVILSYLNATI
jgi:hypothetical protein